MSRFLLLMVFLGLTACTSVVVKNNALPISSTNQCAAPVGASLRYNSLYVALGTRPNGGYGVELLSQIQRNNNYQFIVRERQPSLERVYPQMIVNPCLIIVLPADWQRLTVTNQTTSEQWQLTPADNTNEPWL